MILLLIWGIEFKSRLSPFLLPHVCLSQATCSQLPIPFLSTFNSPHCNQTPLVRAQICQVKRNYVGTLVLLLEGLLNEKELQKNKLLLARLMA